jgi:hypothetical protein
MQAELDKIVKNNGILVKRRSKRERDITGDEWQYVELPRPFGWVGEFDVLNDGTMSDFYCLGPYNSGGDYAITGSGVLSWRRAQYVDNWFVGTFGYYVPDIGSSEWTNRAKGILSGLKPTPGELYALIPWSWLADWFGNVGTILSNLSTNAVDNEVLLNCHVMKQVSTHFEIDVNIAWDEHEKEVGGVPFSHVDPGTDNLHYSCIRVEKLRQKASPFGFGLSSQDFSFWQNSILAALLFSKKRPTLRTFGLD